MTESPHPNAAQPQTNTQPEELLSAVIEATESDLAATQLDSPDPTPWWDWIVGATDRRNSSVLDALSSIVDDAKVLASAGHTDLAIQHVLIGLHSRLEAGETEAVDQLLKGWDSFPPEPHLLIAALTASSKFRAQLAYRAEFFKHTFDLFANRFSSDYAFENLVGLGQLPAHD